MLAGGGHWAHAVGAGRGRVIVLGPEPVYGSGELQSSLALSAVDRGVRIEPMLEAEEPSNSSSLVGQVASFLLHTFLALGAWLALMLAGYILNPAGVPQVFILALSTLIPLAAGFLVCRVRPDEAATAVWLAGLIWILIVSLWILDMPTGPDACFQCDATEKLSRTFFAQVFLGEPKPSGLIDNDGPFLGTWPTAALVGYSIGARLALKRKRPANGN